MSHYDGTGWWATIRRDVNDWLLSLDSGPWGLELHVRLRWFAVEAMYLSRRDLRWIPRVDLQVPRRPVMRIRLSPPDGYRVLYSVIDETHQWTKEQMDLFEEALSAEILRRMEREITTTAEASEDD